MNHADSHPRVTNMTSNNPQNPLKKQIKSIELAWQVLSHHWHHLTLTRLYRQLHSLTQEANQQGYTQLSIHSKPLEIQLQQLQLRGVSPKADLQQHIQNQIQNLHCIIDKLKKTPSQQSLRVSSADKYLLYLYEPNTELREMLSLQLELNGYIVRSFTTSQALITQCQTQIPHLLLLAMQSLEDKHHGIKITQTLQSQIKQHFPIVFLSKNNNVEDRLVALRIHGDAYFPEPIDINALLQKLKSLVHKHNQVLIIDEEKSLGNKYVGYLQQAGIQASLLTQPLQVLNYLQQQRPDVLLIHTQLKSLSSIELAMLIRQQTDYAKLPVLFFAQAFEQTLRRTVMHGVADDFLSENINAKQLIEAVQNCINPESRNKHLLAVNSHKDILTGLYNRDYLLNALKLIKNEQSLSIIALSLDNYRSIDNLMGVIASDSLLVNSSKQLKKLVDKQDILARTHENGFAILSFQRSSKQVQILAEQIRLEIKTHRFKLNGQSLSSTCSIGIAAFDGKHEQAEQTLLDAGAACSLVVQRGGDSVQYHNNHSQTIHQDQIQALIWEKKLRESLAHDRFKLNYQAIANLRDDDANYYEVILQHKQLNSSQFLPIAERCGLSERIDRWMTKQAILSLKQSKHSHINLLLSLTKESLNDRYFLEWLQKTLRIAKLSDNQALILDFSRKDINPQYGTAQHLYTQLHKLGCRLSIRDIETKNDSQLLLHKLPVHFIRISQHLINNLDKDKHKLKQLKRLIQTAHTLNKAVIAPFVSNPRCLNLLWQQQVDHIIGQFVQSTTENLY